MTETFSDIRVNACRSPSRVSYPILVSSRSRRRSPLAPPRCSRRGTGTSAYRPAKQGSWLSWLSLLPWLPCGIDMSRVE